MQRIHESGSFVAGGDTTPAVTAVTGRGRSQAWEDVVRAAGRLAPATGWRESVAEALHRAARGHHVVVFTCPLNRPGSAGQFAVSPAEVGAAPTTASWESTCRGSTRRARGGRGSTGAAAWSAR